ncbi:glycosyltransferase [Paucibacter sp. O1-1]|uniref:glycosyltransferase n=1 Tax=Paucibacter sp. M5-1 TaxID=3015998 RepID=UPI0021D4DD17|nr:glycosyltransferase [Paucibacter sp. M5-1]MCU7373289.1 glycosyltransferase [Paucibacter sp. O1-1]MCZ7879582.1 glycosyltransferase [Paucibacter sp. M5-1]MDA3828288.1 glycosyltransferase [Paucibacter sp. O1-1]
MRISIQTLGTRGDVQPYLALAQGLIRRGHELQLAAPAQFADLVQANGVRFASLPGEFLALLDTPEGKAAVAGGQGFSAGFKLLKQVKPLMRRLLDEEWDVARAFRPDLIVYHPKSLAAPHIAERLGIPALLASPLPGFTPTRAFASPLLPVDSLGPLNRISHLLMMRSADLLFGKMLGQWRETALGLVGRRAKVEAAATLYAYSRHVLPVPQDWDAQRVLVAGYWFLDSGADWQMPASMAQFLAAGDKPVYVGFGSMPGVDAGKLARTVIEGLALAGKRGLLASGGGALEVTEIPPHVHLIASAPHDRLFAHVSATLHHGGAGTTGAALRAGLPTLICPFFGDQPFWGRRIAALGAGPRPLDRRSLSAERLAAALSAMDDPQMRLRANAIGAKIRQEDGVGRAMDFIESHARILLAA